MKIPLPLYCLLPLYPFFKICTPPMPFFPCHLQPTLPLFFLSCFFGWIGDLTTLNVLFQVMIIWIYTCQALWRILISALCNKAPSLQRSDKYFFTGTLIWYHTQKTHTAHSGASRLTHPCKYIFTPPVTCSQQLPLLH